MNARPRVLVAVASETAALRLRLMLEAEGAEVVPPGGSVADVRLVVATRGLAPRARAEAPGVPLLELGDAEDWAALRARLSAALAVPSGESEALAAALVGARLLLVDDSVTYREYLRQNLARMGAQVTVCGGADEARRHLEDGGWDGVLVDLVLPGQDGAALCADAAGLRRRGKGDYVLAVLSSREGRDDLIRSLEAGADLFLRKSQEISLLRVKLGALLRRRRLEG